MFARSHRLWHLTPFVVAFLLTAVLSYCQLSAQHNLQVKGMVVDGDHPAPDTKIVLFKRTYNSAGQKYEKIGESTTDDTGQFVVSVASENFSADRPRAVLHLALNGDEKIIGGLVHYHALRGTTVELPKPISLMNFAEQQLTIVDEHGEPIENAVFETEGFGKVPFSVLRSGGGRQLVDEHFGLPPEFREVVRSNEKGQLNISRATADFYTNGTIKLENGVRFWVAAAPDAPTLTLDCSSKLEGQVHCEDPKFDKTAVKFAAYGPPSNQDGFMIRSEIDLIVSDDGKISADHVPPGIWSINVSSNDDRFYTETGQFTVKAVPGETAELPDVEFHHGIPVRGKILVADTDEGIPDLYVQLNTTRENSRRHFASVQTKSDENGDYVAYVAPGSIQIFLQQIPQKFCPPRYGRNQTPTIDTTTGESSYEFPTVELTRSTTVSGRTLDNEGNAIDGASVRVLSANFYGGGPPGVVYSNDLGEFEIPGVDPDDFVVLRGVADGAVTKGGIVVDPRENGGKVDLVLAEKNTFSITGRIADKSGKAISGVPVELRGSVNYVSRFAQGMGRGSQAGRCMTDENGEFQFRSLFDGDRYRLQIVADGYAGYNSPEVTGRAGIRHDFGTITLARNSLVATGRVVDSRGDPIAGVTVFNSGDAPKKISTTTADDGTFELKGLPDRPFFLFAQADQFRFSSFLVDSVDEPASLLLLRTSETNQYDRLQPYTYEQRKQLCKYMLQQLYSLPADKRSAIDFVIFRYMAMVDPDTAMEMISDPANKRYRQDVTMRVALSIIDDEPDEAIAMINLVDSGNLFHAVLETATRLADQSPETAKQLAENLTARLDKIDPPNKIYRTAQLGKLLVKLGYEEAGEKYFHQAVTEARKLAGTGRESYVLGFTAEQVANWDLEIALELIDMMKETQGTSKPRHMGNIAAAIAHDHPEKALEILRESVEARRAAPRVAFHMAKRSPDQAESVFRLLIESGEQKDACEVLNAIALSTMDDDPEYAAGIIDRIHEITMQHPQDFTSWSNFGFESPTAGFATAIAASINHPDVSSSVAKALASRRGAGETREEIYALKSTVRLAKYLALVDRRVARQLLAQLEDRDELVGGGGYATFGADEWLIAWSLTDHEKAKEIFDAMLEQKASETDVMDQNDLTRILMYITLPDSEFLSRLTSSDGLWYPGRE